MACTNMAPLSLSASVRIPVQDEQDSGGERQNRSGCGRKFTEIYDTRVREVRDLPWSAFTATVVVEIYRVHCPDCGVKRERVPLLPSKAPFSKV